MRRIARIYYEFMRSALIREMEFRANFFAKVMRNVMWIGFFIMILAVIYGNTESVAGWGRADALMLAATVFVMNSLVNACFFGLYEIPSMVRLGSLDFVVTKPVDSQFWVSCRKFNFDEVGTLLAGLIMIGVAVRSGDLNPSVAQWAGYVVLVLASTALYYAFCLMLMTTGIWLVRVDNLWVLGENVLQVARFPLDMYQPALQRLFLYALPLGFIATVPARQLIRGFDPVMVGLGVIWALAALAISRAFWRFAMRHYTSASS
ncbi:MAG: ABC transporter permease [Fimbriimonadaceae bacterium]